MIFLDTGHLVALANARDALHHRAVAWAQRLREPLLVTDYVLVEAVNGLSQRGLRPFAHDLIGQLRLHPRITILASNIDLMNRGLEFHRQRSDKDWSLTDCISFVVMEERGITQALAFDSHFQQAGYEALLRRDP